METLFRELTADELSFIAGGESGNVVVTGPSSSRPFLVWMATWLGLYRERIQHRQSTSAIKWFCGSLPSRF